MLRDATDLECRWSIASLPLALQLVAKEPTDLVLLDKSFGLNAVVEALNGMHNGGAPRAVVWGLSMTEAEALRLVQAGARGILFKTADEAHVLECLRSVSAGLTYMDSGLFRLSRPLEHARRTELTAREQQVLELVEQGKSNRAIALELGIRPGTVKIHLRHVFEKTGVHGRSGLALASVRLSQTAWPEAMSPEIERPEVAASA